MKKKLLILTNHSYMLYRFRRELIAALMEQYQVVLSMPFVGHEQDFQAMGLRCIETPVDRRGINPKTDFRLLRTYDALLRQEQPDLVITYSIKPNIYGGLACARARIPFCANVQGLGTAFQKPVLSQFVTLLYKLALGRCSRVFFENESNAREFLHRHILTADKLTVLPGAGINLVRYTQSPCPPAEPFRFLYLGRIMQEKGMDELFTAVKALKARCPVPFVLELVGFYDDPCYEQQVQELVREGLVDFQGFQEDPLPYYRRANCVVLPSYHEGMSNVLLEAAATGRPLITSDIPGCREAVDPEVTGFLCQPRNTDSLLEQMERMLHLDDQARQAMGNAARRKMEQEFSKDRVVRLTLEALPKL